jgi:ubiquinone/menaquinone biosynthesis C-methylase UbiE
MRTLSRTPSPTSQGFVSVCLVEFDPEVLAYYDRGEEQGRLTARPSLERVRTQALLERFLPSPPAQVLDVGGGAGVYASWLAELGYQVHLVDPVPLHVEQARTRTGFTAEGGDARQLRDPDASWDAVLLLGPLYHLIERADRIQALAEARRVCRPGGMVLAAGISRYASSFDGFFRGMVDTPGFAAVMTENLRTGVHRNPDRHSDWFTTAYFHHPRDLTAEIAEAGLAPGPVLPVEGVLHWLPDIEQRLADAAQRRMVLEFLAAIETDASASAATAHLLAVGTA